MEQTALKICPRCRAKAPLGESVCQSCGHHYSTAVSATPTFARKSSPMNPQTLRSLWLWLIPLALLGGWQIAATHRSHRATLNLGGLWGKPRDVILTRLANFPLTASSENNEALPPKETSISEPTDLEWETVTLAGGTKVSVFFSPRQLDSVVVRHIRVPESSLDNPNPVFRRFSMTVATPPDVRQPMMAQWNNWEGHRLRLLTKVVGGPVTAMKIDALGGVKVHDDSLAVP